MSDARTAPRVTVGQAEQRHRAAALVMNDLFLRHFVRTYHAFEGDLVAAVVLGEVAHHNVSVIRARARTVIGLHEALEHPGFRAEMVPTNAFSIAAATGIPRETVRRKVAYLVKRGFLTQDAGANLYVSPEASGHFQGFNVDLINEVLAVAQQLHILLDPAAAVEGTGGAAAPRPEPHGHVTA